MSSNMFYDPEDILRDDTTKDWQKLVQVAQFHDAAHAYLADNHARMGLFKHEGFATDQNSPVTNEGGRTGYEPTPVGHLLASGACSFAKAFAMYLMDKSAGEGSIKALTADDMKELMLRAMLFGARLGIAHARDELRDWQEAFVSVPDVFKVWTIAPDEHQPEEDGHEQG